MLKKLAAICVTSVLLASCSTTGSLISNSSSSKESYLFMRTADSAQIKANPADSTSYIMVLNNANPDTYWFTDRPVRKAGIISNKKYFANWNKGPDSFAKDNPNAGLVSEASALDANGQQVVDVITLSKPIYNAKAKTVKYVIKPVNPKSFQHKPGLYKKPVMFVDGISDRNNNGQWDFPECYLCHNMPKSNLERGDSIKLVVAVKTFPTSTA